MPPDDPHEQRLHDLFQAFRDRVYPPRSDAWREQVRAGVSQAAARPRRGPSLLAVLGAGLVHALNLLAAATGGDEPAERRPPDSEGPDD